MKAKKMKKALCLLLAGTMVFGATACGSSNKKGSGEKGKAEEQVLRLAISGEPTILTHFKFRTIRHIISVMQLQNHYSVLQEKMEKNGNLDLLQSMK